MTDSQETKKPDLVQYIEDGIYDVLFDHAQKIYIESEYAISCNNALENLLNKFNKISHKSTDRSSVHNLFKYYFYPTGSVYKHIRMKKGYELIDMHYDFYDGAPTVYAHKIGESEKIPNDDNRKEVLEDKDLCDSINSLCIFAMDIDESEYGIFEMSLFCKTIGRYHICGHANYGTIIFLFSFDDLMRLKSNNNYRGLFYLSDEEIEFYKNYDFRPYISSIGIYHRVSLVSYFPYGDWRSSARGLCRLQLYFKGKYYIAKTHKFLPQTERGYILF